MSEQVKFNGSELRRLRNKAKLTQGDLAVKIGLSKGSGAAIGNWENGRANPRDETVKRIATVFSVEPEVLFKKTKTVKTSQINSKPKGSIDLIQAQTIAESTSSRFTRAEETSLHTQKEQFTLIGTTNEGHLILQSDDGILYRAVAL